MARKMCVQMGLPFSCEKICEKVSESMWRVMEWVCDEKIECCDLLPEESVQVEEYELVAPYKQE